MSVIASQTRLIILFFKSMNCCHIVVWTVSCVAVDDLLALQLTSVSALSFERAFKFLPVRSPFTAFSVEGWEFNPWQSSN